MTRNVVAAGFGGQGVMLLGQNLGTGSNSEAAKRHLVTFIWS